MRGSLPSEFDQLVAEVHDRAAGAEAPGLLDAAVVASAEHAAIADRLLDHFVIHARDKGMSWTDIGARLGVSKQAARQRFADRRAAGVLPFATQPAPRLRACLDSAAQHARTESAAAIGTEHLLAGLLAEGVAAAILERLHVTPEAIQTSSRRLFQPATGPAAAGIPPMSPEARAAVDAAECNAAHDLDSPCPEVRTEHLLSALALDPGSRARRVLNDLDVDIAAIKSELRPYTTCHPARPARWWKRRPPTQHGCSFCGRSQSTVGDLVNGPGVAICSACVALAADILEEPQHTP